MRFIQFGTDLGATHFETRRDGTVALDADTSEEFERAFRAALPEVQQSMSTGTKLAIGTIVVGAAVALVDAALKK